MRKRILALFMAAILFVGILPAATFADETDAVPESSMIAEEITEPVADSTESTQATTAATEEPAEPTVQTTCATEATEPSEETLLVEEEVSDLTLSDPESTETEHEINSADDLVALYNEVAAGDSKAGHSYTFTTDITLPEGWKPIGILRPGTNGSDAVNEEHILPFSGVIDGAGHTLTVPEDGLPLLGYVKGATVRNLNIYGTKIAGAGLVNNYTLRFKVPPAECSAIIIDNVTLKSGSKTLKSGLVAASDPNQYACASAGFTVTIRNSVIEAGVTIGYDKQESQIGSFAARISGTIEDCESSAVVYGKDYVGGILGTKDNAMGKCQVRNCKFHGTVEASGSYAGGIVGGGYDNSTAPNGGCPTILLCSVDGVVKGDARVGGIFGGDGFVAQTWDNVVGSISFNNFTGTVSGKKYVGAIIGYRNSLNKYDTIRDNTFSAGCGADKGIGFVQYLDTSYANPATMEGTIVFNTGAGVSKCPDVEGCEWKADHNRTDDPLGVDAEKLCKKTGAEDSPSCYELKVSGAFKTEYTVGQELDLTGIELTAYWTDGSTTEVELKDVIITGYQKNTVGEQKVTLSYESAIAYITVTVKPDSTKIQVSVSILGDSHHSDPTSNGGPHGLAMGGLTTWVSVSGVQADAKETVWDVLQRVGESKGIRYSADSNNSYGTVYIRGVNGLSEFDNGPNSGWMYTVNGSHPNVGVSARYVKNGDKIVLHYTDDYTYEEGGIHYGQSVEKDAAKKVDELIEKIGTVTFTDECKQRIDAARKAYNALSAADKEKVTKLAILEAAEKEYEELKKADDKRKAQKVIDLINQIGTPTLDRAEAIQAALDAYKALTADQKKLVTNLTTLQSAVQKWNQLAAEEVMKLIDKIGEPVTEKSEKAIQEARTAYDKLTDDQKKLVKNYKILDDAETALAMLLATDEDKRKAKEVVELIEKLTNVTLDSEKDIQEARKAYDALSALQKKLVENYDLLEAAERQLALLKALEKLGDPFVITGDFLETLGTPNVGSIGGEWMVIGLARSDREVPNVAEYYQKVVDYVQENVDENQRLHKAKSTDNARLILALTAIGKDVTDVDGHNLLLGLNDLDFVKWQGNNGPIWALLALNCGNYPVPEGGNVTRQALIDEILSVQTSDYGWAISGDEADSDMTGMALQALAPYYNTDIMVQQAVDLAIARLSEMQNDDGGFSTFSGSGGKVATSESISQIIVALTALGINPDTDARFIKNGNSAIDALLQYYVTGGGFKHVMDGQRDGMATEQAYYALTSYYRLLSGQTSLYDMTDVIDMGGNFLEISEEETTVPATTQPGERKTDGAKTAKSSDFPWLVLVLSCVISFCAGALAATVVIFKFIKED